MRESIDESANSENEMHSLISGQFLAEELKNELSFSEKRLGSNLKKSSVKGRIEERQRVATKLATTVRIAASIAYPLKVAASEASDCSNLSTEDLYTVSQHPSFNAPLNRAFSKLSGLENLAIDTKSLRRLGHNSASSIALQLATDTPEIVLQASCLLGAVILNKQILSCTLKADREALQDIIGYNVYQISTREAPMLYSILGELDDGSFSLNSPLSVRGNSEKFYQDVVAIGQTALRLFVGQTEPVLEPLFIARNPLLPSGLSVQSPLKDTHISHIVKLLRRRFLPWLHIID